MNRFVLRGTNYWTNQVCNVLTLHGLGRGTNRTLCAEFENLFLLIFPGGALLSHTCWVKSWFFNHRWFASNRILSCQTALCQHSYEVFSNYLRRTQAEWSFRFFQLLCSDCFLDRTRTWSICRWTRRVCGWRSPVRGSVWPSTCGPCSRQPSSQTDSSESSPCEERKRYATQQRCIRWLSHTHTVSLRCYSASSCLRDVIWCICLRLSLVLVQVHMYKGYV